MKYLFCWSLFIHVLFGCSPGNDSSDENPEKVIAADTMISQSRPLTGCYRMTIARDTADITLRHEGNRVQGTLVYNRFEKDDNNGTFEGIIENGIINGWYHYQSEGMISVKQVRLKIREETLEEGYGDLELKNDTAYFKYPTSITYEANHPYKKIACN